MSIRHPRHIVHVLVALLAGCGAPPDARHAGVADSASAHVPVTPVDTTAERPMTSDAATLHAAPTSATIDGVTVTAEAYLWLDAMPGAGSITTPLLASVRLGTASGAPLPRDCSAGPFWALAGDTIWEAVPTGDDVRVDAASIELVGRDGPAWAEGRSVDVVVRLRDARGRSMLVRAPTVRIARAD